MFFVLFGLGFCFCFETESQVVQAGLKLITSPRRTLNFGFS